MKVNTIGYHDVKEQFTVKPQEHYLELKGYNPTDDRASKFRYVEYAKHDEFMPEGSPASGQNSHYPKDDDSQARIVDVNTDDNKSLYEEKRVHDIQHSKDTSKSLDAGTIVADSEGSTYYIVGVRKAQIFNNFRFYSKFLKVSISTII